MSRRITNRETTLYATTLSELVTAKGGKLIFTDFRDRKAAFLFRDNRLIYFGIHSDADDRPLVQIGRVTDVKERIGACFIEVGNSEVCFLKLSNIPDSYMPVHQGDLIPVMTLSEAQKGKRTSVTAKIPWRKLEGGIEASARAKHLTAFSVVIPGRSFYERVIHDEVHISEFEEIVTDNVQTFECLKNGDSSLVPESICIRLYEDSSFSLSKLYSIETHIEKALSDKIWLPSGGYLIMNTTEALTVFDVNSGKFEAGKGISAEENAVKINWEAAEELAIQLRLRNLSGMILTDFINMSEEEHKLQLLNYLEQLCRFDTVPVRVVDITALGIVEMTRKKRFAPIKEQISDII